MTEYLLPISSKTNNKWHKAQVENRGINRKKGLKDLTIFEKYDMVGFEEIVREFIIFKHSEK
jgi:hypothetical protein